MELTERATEHDHPATVMTYGGLADAATLTGDAAMLWDDDDALTACTAHAVLMAHAFVRGRSSRDPDGIDRPAARVVTGRAGVPLPMVRRKMTAGRLPAGRGAA